MVSTSLRLSDELHKKMTEEINKHGFSTYNEFMRAALRHYITHLNGGEDD